MKRLLAPIPLAGYSVAQLRALAVARFPKVIDHNIVTVDGIDNSAVYVPDADTTPPTAWQQAVAAYTVTHPTPEESAVAAQSNADTVRVKAQQALTANVAARSQIATFVAQAKPATAALQASAAYDAVKQLAGITDTALRELNALLRLTLNALDDVSDT